MLRRSILVGNFLSVEFHSKAYSIDEAKEKRFTSCNSSRRYRQFRNIYNERRSGKEATMAVATVACARLLKTAAVGIVRSLYYNVLYVARRFYTAKFTPFIMSATSCKWRCRQATRKIQVKWSVKNNFTPGDTKISAVCEHVEEKRRWTAMPRARRGEGIVQS